VIRDDADPAAGVGPADGGAKAAVERVELVVHLDAQGLEGLARGVAAVSPCCRRDPPLDHTHELEGRLDGLPLARGHDLVGDATRKALVSVYA